MANYYATTRTNYFTVKDADKARDVLKRIVLDEQMAEIWEETDENGKTVFGFGGSGALSGILPPGTSYEDYRYDADDYDNAICELQSIVADDDAILIMEAGHEKLNYVTGIVVIVTSHDTDYVDMQYTAAAKAAAMLKNPQWSTKCEY